MSELIEKLDESKIKAICRAVKESWNRDEKIVPIYIALTLVNAILDSINAGEPDSNVQKVKIPLQASPAPEQPSDVERVAMAIAAFTGSSNGRTADFDSANLGSNPSPVTNAKRGEQKLLEYIKRIQMIRGEDDSSVYSACEEALQSCK